MFRFFTTFICIFLSAAVFGQTIQKLEKKFARLQQQGKTEKATEVMQEICERNAEVYFFLFDRATKLCAEKDYKFAAKAVNEALGCHNYPLPATAEFFKKKERAFSQGLVVMNEVIRHDSTAVNLGNRASLKKVLGKIPEAIFDYTCSIGLDSTNYMTFHNRGCLYNEENQLEEALADFTQALELNAELTDSYLNRGFVRLKMEDYEEAIHDFKWMLGTNALPIDRAFCLNNMGYAYLMLGDLDKAKEHVNESVRMLPTNSFAHRNLALISIEEDDFENACRHLAKSVELGFTRKYGEEVEQLQLKYCN